jgi:hypothetical protein
MFLTVSMARVWEKPSRSHGLRSPKCKKPIGISFYWSGAALFQPTLPAFCRIGFPEREVFP